MESDAYIEETIGLIPRTGGSRQARILLNAFFIRPRIKTISNRGLMFLTFSRPDQHLLSFYELRERLLSRKLSLSDLLILMQTLRDVRETRKIDAMYRYSLEDLESRLKTEEPARIAEALMACQKECCLSRRIFSEIETTLAFRQDGPEVGLYIAETVSEPTKRD